MADGGLAIRLFSDGAERVVHLISVLVKMRRVNSKPGFGYCRHQRQSVGDSFGTTDTNDPEYAI